MNSRTSRPPARSASRPLLAERHVARLLVGTLAGRLPNGMAPVAILLLIAEQGGSLAAGGLLCALYGLASAIGQPALGRMVDRRGQTRVTAAAVLITTVCLLLLPYIDAVLQPALAAGLVVLAGLSTPPLEANLRALWGAVLPDPERRRAALALDTGAQGLIYVAGPPLVALLSAVHGPGVAMTVTAALGLLGATTVLSAAPSRAWLPAVARAGGFLGPLQHGGLRLLFLAVGGVGFALGSMNVWAVAMADRHGMTLLSGLIPAALSIGSLVGGILYGRRRWPGRLSSQLVTAALLFAAAWVPLTLGPGPLAATAFTALPGLFLTALITSAFLTVDALAPAGTRTEAYAWLIAAVGTGQAAGTALAGVLSTGPRRASLTLAGMEAPGPPRLRPTPHRFPATTDRRSALPEAPAEPFMTIRHTITGEITTTGYNAAARRILLQAGFEETPGCACRATEPGTERAHGPRQPASCSSPAIPCTWTEPSVGR
ncbi:putative MFS family arabinose efflux permease [Streptomyces avidinii]|uniref:MFS transporter n=1 Tax=[Kitasatospora] papulosa TaxID=1464011 RepID=UPI000BD182FB|nr:putative MFS family arabinose efflux permease [Streptomyces avidinii]WSZ50889.1 MFS transporter [[Kitasatospora] papulosa]SNX80764.1 Predicted arabinose efflux permease, MFS family [Streptomyces microflavus]